MFLVDFYMIEQYCKENYAKPTYFLYFGLAVTLKFAFNFLKTSIYQLGG